MTPQISLSPAPFVEPPPTALAAAASVAPAARRANAEDRGGGDRAGQDRPAPARRPVAPAMADAATTDRAAAEAALSRAAARRATAEAAVLTGEARALEAKDRAVRARATAQLNAGAPHAGPVVYDYRPGPDGRRYATGGRVVLDVSPAAAGPHATAAKMRAVVAAAAASNRPSVQDMRLAGEARALLTEALAAIRSARDSALLVRI